MFDLGIAVSLKCMDLCEVQIALGIAVMSGRILLKSIGRLVEDAVRSLRRSVYNQLGAEIEVSTRVDQISLCR
jgi:hypothetical protein